MRDLHKLRGFSRQRCQQLRPIVTRNSFYILSAGQIEGETDNDLGDDTETIGSDLEGGGFGKGLSSLLPDVQCPLLECERSKQN